LDAQNQVSNRSQLIWDTLCKSFITDLLLIKTPELLAKKTILPDGFDEVFTLSTANKGLLKTKAIYQFSPENKDRFGQILLRKRYEMVFFRGISCAELVNLTEITMPECTLVMDVDCLLSSRAELVWQQNPTWKNIPQKLEYLKLRLLENSLFRKPCHFFFSNNNEKQLALKHAGISADNPNFGLLPNCLPAIESPAPKQSFTDAEKVLLADKFILFYGNLETTENTEAFSYIAKEIYPRISKQLLEKDIKLYIVGNNQQRIHTQYSGGRLKLIGAVENLNAYIKASLFVILPVYTASGAITRILETALLKKAVLTTTPAAAGLDFSSDDIAIEDKTDDYCKRLIQMLQFPGKTVELGHNLSQKVHSLYGRKAVEKSLTESLIRITNKAVSKSSKVKLRIALITNDFPSEQSETATNLYIQIKKLAEIFEVTVFTPRRLKSPRMEVIDNITIYRLFDILNYPVRYPNSKSKTLCPELFVLLLKQEFDIIQCYPGINRNNKLAWLVAKIKETPIILNSQSLLDYADIFKAQDSINPFLLQTITLKWQDKLFLKNLDYIFTFSEREYEFLRKLNERIEQVPVPVQSEKTTVELPSFRQRYYVDKAAFVFICMGELTFQGGQDIALKAFTQALPNLPDAKLVLAGSIEAEPEFMQEIESFIEREALQEEVIITGNLELHELWAWRQEADISVLPARFATADAAAAESWLQGIPVLQSDAVDPNLIIDGYNGYLFRSEDVEDLALQMQKALANQTKLSKMAELGRALVKDKHTYDALLKRYVKIYKQLTS